ncbi:ryptide family R-Y-crosslinked RiPP peptide [Streptococcus cuniculi]|nr:ryptide family R-Y-crosslinked RiPP peptide [Streptococcus cuniculi]
MSIEFTEEELLQMKAIDDIMTSSEDKPSGIIVGQHITRRRY